MTNQYTTLDISRLMEKHGWRIMDMGAGDNFRMTEDPFYAHQHRLITAYLADDGFGERCDEVIRSIFEV